MRVLSSHKLKPLYSDRAKLFLEKYQDLLDNLPYVHQVNHDYIPLQCFTITGKRIALQNQFPMKKLMTNAPSFCNCSSPDQYILSSSKTQ